MIPELGSHIYTTQKRIWTAPDVDGKQTQTDRYIGRVHYVDAFRLEYTIVAIESVTNAPAERAQLPTIGSQGGISLAYIDDPRLGHEVIEPVLWREASSAYSLIRDEFPEWTSGEWARLHDACDANEFLFDAHAHEERYAIADYAFCNDVIRFVEILNRCDQYGENLIFD